MLTPLKFKYRHRLARGIFMLAMACVLSAVGFADDSETDASKVVAPQPIKSVTANKVFTKEAPESISELLIIQQRVQKLASKLDDCTVAVRIGTIQGSGVIVGSEGYVLTAAHVAGEPGSSAEITLADGRQVQGETLGMNHRLDAALIKLEGDEKWPSAEMGNVADVKIGNWCIAIGHPGGYRKDRPPVVRLGRVVMNHKLIIQSDCTIVGGDSGGPLFDFEGRVIGIHGRIGALASWNFHVPISAYRKGWERMVASEAWGEPSGLSERALLGVSGDDHERGCRVTHVYSETPAEEIGLQIGDVITEFDGEPVRGFNGLAINVRKRDPGDKVTLEILRGEEILHLEVVLTKHTD